MELNGIKCRELKYIAFFSEMQLSRIIEETFYFMLREMHEFINQCCR